MLYTYIKWPPTVEFEPTATGPWLPQGQLAEARTLGLHLAPEREGTLQHVDAQIGLPDASIARR